MTIKRHWAQGASAVLIAGVAIFSFLKWGEKNRSATAKAPAAVARPPGSALLPSSPPSKTGGQVATEFPELVEKYGASRVAFSKPVAQQLIGMMTQLGSPKIADTPEESKPGYLLDTELHLTPQQEEKYYALLKDFRKRRDEKVAAKDAALTEGYGDMMAMLLAADARASGKMSEQDYQSLVEERGRAHLITVPGIPRSGGGYKAMDDETFSSGLMAVLTPDQQRQLQDANEQRIAVNKARTPEVVPPRTLEEVKGEMDGIIQSFEGAEKMLKALEQDNAGDDGK